MITTGSALLLGLGAGVISGLLGVGGGVVLVPGLILLFGLSPHKAIGISLSIIVPTALIGAMKHYSLGNVDLRVAVPVVIGGIVGGFLGAWLTSFISAPTLKRIFAVFLIFIGLNMLFDFTGKLLAFGGNGGEQEREQSTDVA